MARIWLILLLFTSGVCPGADRDSGEEPVAARVIILANSRDSESQQLARYYAEKRSVPRENIIELPLSGEESLQWPDFVATLFQPLQDELVRRKWIDAISSELRDAVGRRKYAISGHRISYLVVCRGVPLKVADQPDLRTSVPPFTDRDAFKTNEGAVDSELSLLAMPNYPISAFVLNPLFGKTRTTVFDEARVIKVSRLDGPSQEAARAMIDSALQAEKQGLIGRAYVDVGGLYPAGDVWFEKTAEKLVAAGFEVTTDRTPATLGPTVRFDAPVLYFGWYAGDINGPFTQPGFRFPPGAIALHLHSFSARTLNSHYEGWTGPLVARGVAATVGNVNEPFLDFTHRPQLLVEALLEGRRWGDAVYRSLRVLSWQPIALGDPLYRPLARSFADQWAARKTLPAQWIPYVVLREIHRLEQDGSFDEARALADATLRESPSWPVALKRAQLAEAEGRPEDARKALSLPRGIPQTAEFPLAIEAAERLARLGEPARAVELYQSLLAAPDLSREFKAVILPAAVRAAREAGMDSLASDWTREMERARQGG